MAGEADEQAGRGSLHIFYRKIVLYVSACRMGEDSAEIVALPLISRARNIRVWTGHKDYIGTGQFAWTQ